VPQVTISLDPSLETEIKAGDKVGIDLPEGGATTGVVTQVSKVASTNAAGVTSVPVYVSLDHPKVAKNLSSAPVTVTVTTGSVANALVVPVAALVARSGGGYAVEVTGPGGHRLVKVTVGLFDDAAGVVQVTGNLAPGQHVVVPAL
jgi:multidrug efflux pump subunit AcrA (membrane-fusion protein)